jgi:hypothetical protein
MTVKLLSQEHAKALIMAYGSEPDRWPSEWRESLIVALAGDPALRECAAAEAKLDQMMASESADPSISVASILAFTAQSVARREHELTEAPVGVLERFIEWLCFSGFHSTWRSVAVASMALALGVGLGLGVAAPPEDEWVASEAYVFALVEGG